MIQANVCAAETLEQKKTPADLPGPRHAQPGEDLQTWPTSCRPSACPGPRARRRRTERFNKLLDETRDGAHAEIVNEVVLRTQMQAIYSTENIGHFGLNLDRYAHFTSPIRRYADLIVHRALIRALGWATTA